ncbi:restriction endonuclease subunit S [Levilactobacillus brevis]|uniref:restriction endonuclease subunit S n=1 Tax=Levilactobacillus brevis TaxID=1580 RepID=UPI0005A9CCA4|nr:restriction endonuclease subunit S [Levilactobacillus brevis]
MKANQAKYPQLRFKGFTDPWEQRSFKTLYKKVIEKNDLSFESDRIISVANMYYKPNDSKSDEKYMETYNIFRLGDIAFEGHKSKNFAYGRFVENTIGDGIVSHVFDVFRPISEYDLNYWKYFIHYEDIMGQKLRMSTTKATMMNNLVSKDFLKQSVLVPNVDEQQKIGTFFKQLDYLITLHQRKLAKLKELKQGYLQKLFPKNGSKSPQLRFAGFADAWEQRKLSDAVDNIGTGKSKYMLQEKSDLAKYEVLGSTSVIGYDEDYDHEGDFILTARVGANAGNLYHHSGKVKITDNTVFIQGKNLAFIYNLLTQFDLKKLSFGTGQPLVKASELKNLILYFPNNDEQAKIGSYFKQLDHLITLHQRKLEKLQELKKGYLQKMFC